MGDKPLVFMSSTSEFGQQRELLADALPASFELFFYERAPARGGSPRELCERRIRECDVFVGILGASAGSDLPGDERGRTIVEWEFDTAAEVPDLERMVFVHAPPGGLRPEPRQVAFVERVTDFEGGSWCKPFTTPADLLDGVREALVGWLVRRWSRLRSRQSELLGWLTWRVAVVVGLALVIAVACLHPAVQDQLTTSAIVAILSSVFVAALVAVLVLRREQGNP